MVYGEGPIPCVGMLVGEAPGESEARLGRPFVGRSGELLEEAIGAAGASRGDFYITNCYKLRPEGNRNPTKEELDSHWSLLLREIADVRPYHVLLLGNIALHNFFPHAGGITRARGFVGQSGERKYWATYHPSYVLRGNGREQFFQDVADFVYACGPFHPANYSAEEVMPG